MDAEVAVNIVAPVSAQTGYSAHALGFAAALDARMPVALIDAARWPAVENWHQTVASALRRPPADNVPTIWIGPVRSTAALPGPYPIGWVTWETTIIPADFRSALRQFREIWVPSAFCGALIAAAMGSERPIHVVPEGVDSQRFRPRRGTARRRPFRFLSVGKWEARKGHEVCLAAFLRAFAAGDDVELVMRCSLNHATRVADRLTIAGLLARIPRPLRRKVRVLDGDDVDMPALYASADAFVLTTRAEAWGLPILEAMASGLPCIVTDYGGHLDFCTPRNSLLCRTAGLVTARDPVYFPSPVDWGQWAQPDERHAAQLMRQVYDERGKAEALGQRARRDAAHRWTWSRSAFRAEALLSKSRARMQSAQAEA